jgi:hypothetical protein
VEESLEGDLVAVESLLRIVDHGAWNGGTIVDNSVYENTGMLFKGGIPVTDETIQSRIGVQTRVAAPDDERIGVLALRDLLESSDLDFSRTKVIIGATNVGEDKYDLGPHIRHARDLVAARCPDAVLFDLYAGCPGFNVAVGLLLALSQAGFLTENDISIIVGAENIHRAKAFPPGHTAKIIFGDDAMATALRTTATLAPSGSHASEEALDLRPGDDLVSSVASALFLVNGTRRLDGIIIDNQTGDLRLRIPASAARVQHRLIELINPEAVAAGVFGKFKSALDFYEATCSSSIRPTSPLSPPRSSNCSTTVART